MRSYFLISLSVFVITLSLFACSKNGEEDHLAELEITKSELEEKKQKIDELQLEIVRLENEIEQTVAPKSQQSDEEVSMGYLDIEFFDKPHTINELLIKRKGFYGTFPFGYAVFSGYYAHREDTLHEHLFVITEGNSDLIEHLYHVAEEGNTINEIIDDRLAISIKPEISLVSIDTLSKSSAERPIQVMFALLNYEWPEQDRGEGYEYARAITVFQ